LTTSTFAQVELGICQTLLAYARGVDTHRPEDIVATFCPDGSMTMSGIHLGTGHEALHAAVLDWPTNRSVHMIVNVATDRWSQDTVEATSDLLAFMGSDAPGWTIVVGRYVDTLHNTNDGWRLHDRVLTFF
jgi:hypothetical protein